MSPRLSHRARVLSLEQVDLGGWPFSGARVDEDRLLVVLATRSRDAPQEELRRARSSEET